MDDSDLAKHIAAGIRSYAGGEGDAYSYHGDGSALRAMNRLDKEADGIAQYIITNMESLLDAADDAMEAALLAHRPVDAHGHDNDEYCYCGGRNNMDGDVMHSHRISVVSEALRTVLGIEL